MEIRDEHYEWAAIDRLGKMLKSPHSKFKTTHTYSTFTAILCWTTQRIRTCPIRPGKDIYARVPPEDDPNFKVFDAIQIALHNECIEGFFGKLPKATGNLNTLKLEDDEGNPISALAFLISLRNAVAHGDGRSVKAVNRPKQLVGFEFSLSNPHGFPAWSSVTQLNRSAQVQIAGKMVDVFCEKFREQHPASESDLATIGESE